MPEHRPGEAWTVGIDDDREGYWKFDSEQAAVDFAHFDSQLEGAAAVVLRWDGALATVVAEFVR